MVVSGCVRDMWLLVRDCPNPAYLDLEEHVILGTSLNVKITELDSKWNQRMNEVDENTQIVGYHGMDPNSKRDFIESEISKREFTRRTA
jgi:hypothetical protein